MTSRYCSLAAVLILAASVSLPTAAHAQQVSAPGATQLYAQMMAAMQQAASVHMTVRTVALPNGPHQTVRENFTVSADVSSQQQVLHAVSTQTIASASTGKVLVRQHTEIVAVDGRWAERSGSGSWSCESVSTDFWQGSLTSLVSLNVTPHFIGGVGSGKVLGIPVWRLKLDLSNRIDVLNIAQETYRLVRVTEVRGSKNAADGVHKHVTDFTQYGKPVVAQLPQACA